MYNYLARRQDILRSLHDLEDKRREIENRICHVAMTPEEDTISDCQDKAEDMLVDMNRLIGKLRLLKDLGDDY